MPAPCEVNTAAPGYIRYPYFGRSVLGCIYVGRSDQMFTTAKMHLFATEQCVFQTKPHIPLGSIDPGPPPHLLLEFL